MKQTIRLIVGLGNPGPRYSGTRHNAGAAFVSRLAEQQHIALQTDRRFSGAIARLSLDGADLRVLLPGTYMNLSGQAVAALAGFYRIGPGEILVAHDELDIAPGLARLKRGGGNGGHNGLKSVTASLGNDSGYLRLRLGIGHPGARDDVTGHVLSRAPADERAATEAAIEEALRVLPLVVSGRLDAAMHNLHSFKAENIRHGI